MKNSILVALKDSLNSKNVVDYVAGLPFQTGAMNITLLHVFKKPSSSEALMGNEFTLESLFHARLELESARDRLIHAGIPPELIRIRIAEEPYPTITDGIIAQFRQGPYDMIVIGRRKKSKSEEFVMGDVSVKLVRELEGSAILVVKT